MKREIYIKILRQKGNLIFELERKLDYSFSRKVYLIKALIHSSYANEKQEEGLKSNERLEFIGDSVLNYIITTVLYKLYPEMDEGFLSKARSFLVSTETIYKLCLKLNLGKYILLGRGEVKTGGRKKKNLLVDTFEALVAAIYFDGGLKSVRKVIQNLYSEMFESLKKEKIIPFDYKSKLQEYLAKRGSESPRYLLIEEVGPDHNKFFKVQVKIGEENFGIGEGHSKKEAQQIAAKNTIEILEGKEKEKK